MPQGTRSKQSQDQMLVTGEGREGLGKDRAIDGVQGGAPASNKKGAGDLRVWVGEAKAFSRSQAGTVPGSSLFAIQDLCLVATTGQA